MQKITTHKCTRCGREFSVPSLPSATEEIAFQPESRVSLDRYLTATCPNCGHVDDAKERRFFGVFGPMAIRGFVFLFVAAMIVVIAYVIYADMK